MTTQLMAPPVEATATAATTTTEMLLCEACGVDTADRPVCSKDGFESLRSALSFTDSLCDSCTRETYRAFQAGSVARGSSGFLGLFAALGILVTRPVPATA